jgi:hypothetical protein
VERWNGGAVESSMEPRWKTVIIAVQRADQRICTGLTCSGTHGPSQSVIKGAWYLVGRKGTWAAVVNHSQGRYLFYLSRVDGPLFPFWVSPVFG